MSKKLNAVTYEVEITKSNNRKWNPAITLDRMRKYYSRSSWDELDQIIDDPDLWEGNEDDNLIVETDEIEDLPTSPIEEDMSDDEVEVSSDPEPGKPTRIQPKRAVKLRQLKSYTRYFDVNKQTYYLFPPAHQAGAVYKITASQILAAKELGQVKKLYSHPSSVHINVNSRAAQSLVDKVATLTTEYYKLNGKHYPVAFPYHRQLKIREAVRELFSV